MKKIISQWFRMIIVWPLNILVLTPAIVLYCTNYTWKPNRPYWVMIGTVLFCLGLVLEIWAIHCFIRTKAIEEAYRRAEYIRTMRSKGVRDKIAFISDAPGMEAANKAITERFFKKLITGGPYVYMRNPIITALYIMQIAESLLLNSEVAFTLFGAFLLSNMIYFPFTEERILEKRFGKLYQKYKREVPRWIPRLTPWVYSRASSSKISP